MLVVDQGGEVLSGSLDDLVEAVHAGAPIRVGWELAFNMPDEEEARRLVHWTDAGFVSTWQGHVFAQIDDIYQQGPIMDEPGIHLIPGPHGWTAILGTTGEMRQVYGDEGSTMPVKTTWAVVR